MVDQNKTVIGILLAIGILVLLGFPGVLQAVTEQGSGISHEFSWHGIEFKAACSEPGAVTDGAGNLLAQRDSELAVTDGSVRMAVSGAPFRQPPGGIGCLLQTDNLDLAQYSRIKLSMFGQASSAHKRAGSTVALYVTDGVSDVPVAKAFTDGYYQGMSGWGDVSLDMQSCALGPSSTLRDACVTATKTGGLWTMAPLDMGLRSTTRQAVGDELAVAEAARKGPQDISFLRFGTRDQLNLLFEVGAGNGDDKGGGVSASLEITQVEITDKQGDIITVVSNRTRPTLDQLLVKGIVNGGLDQSTFTYVGDVKPVNGRATFVPIPTTGDIGYTGQGEVIITAPTMASGMVEPAVYVFEQLGDVGGQRTRCGAGLVMGVDNHTIYDVNNLNIIPTVGSVGLEADKGKKLPFEAGFSQPSASSPVQVEDVGSEFQTQPVQGGGVRRRIILVYLPDDKVMWSFDDGASYSPARKVVSSGAANRDKDDIVFGAQTNNGGLCPVTFQLLSAKRMTLEKYLTDGLVAGTAVTDVQPALANVTVQDVTPEQLAQDEDDVLQLLDDTRQGLRNQVRGGGLGTSGSIILAILAAIAVYLAVSKKKQ